MSRLYANAATVDGIVAHFGAEPADITVPLETVEGAPGLVVRESPRGRLLKATTWGFPRLTSEMRMRGESSGRIGLVADLTNPMWEHLVVDPRYRCLIPLTHFANPDGDLGEKTRAWFSVEGEPLFAWAGFCRTTEDFGPVHAGMTMTANERVMPYNDRMPVLLAPHEYDRWLRGSIQGVLEFQFRSPLEETRTVIELTENLWRSGSPPPSGRPQLALL